MAEDRRALELELELDAPGKVGTNYHGQLCYSPAKGKKRVVRRTERKMCHSLSKDAHFHFLSNRYQH